MTNEATVENSKKEAVEAATEGWGAFAVPPTGRASAPMTLPELDLVRAAVKAPSPDNNQPWLFRFDRGKLLVYEDPARRLPSDVCSMFSFLGLGAAVENVVIESSRHGLTADVTCLARSLPLPLGEGRGEGGPNRHRPGAGKSEPLQNQVSCDMPVAEIRFSPGAEPDGLAAVLEARCTNRYGYLRQPVPGEALDRMVAAATRFDGCSVTWLTERRSIRRISKLVAVADRLRFERAEFHAELFRQLRLTPDEAECTRDGLDLRTLGLPLGAGLMLRSLRSWPLVRALNRVGLSRMLTLPSAALTRKSGAIGVLTVARPVGMAFFDAGRALERLWLTATDLRLALHPLGSLPIFVGHHELLSRQLLGTRHTSLAADLSRAFRTLLPAAGGRTLVMVFRVGTSTATPTRSLRRPVEDVLSSAPSSTLAERHCDVC
ncbi:MAG TPA: hypothetical protein VG826_32225 [Pirellulales bacterium]|nr:hypothetical protein [Pirellulales bacterium]